MDGKTALAFLPIGTYTKYWGNEIGKDSGNYNAAAPLLIAQRYAMKPEDDKHTITSTSITYDQESSLVQEYNTLSNGIKTKEQAYNTLYTTAKDNKSASFIALKY